MSDSLQGTWKLIAWRRISDDGTTTYPIGKDARGQLVYTPDGRMAVQIAGPGRPALPTADPLGGDVTARAGAYSTYLAYFGKYEVRGETVVHRIDASLFPNWSGEEQVRSLRRDHGELVLRTSPMQVADGTTVVNELAWAREDR